ncbi:potassium transporter TrkA [Brachybacterium endophyticum]|uniref:Trk system potassium uptake protein TrkA n=1 Tax=Brachybacterium endophyticum TaxID=2182385 RepID=A0A2U2RIZ4_9MICO|nr:TrkA family potassium uptake protein [Brachybacterium endophyticum]PWH05830.1 potassium transporter TrkA [Brachybacterium endophyticum]
MRVVIIGAGSVGRSIARELLTKGRSVTLVDRQVSPEKRSSVTGVQWVEGDAAELAVLSEADVAAADVVVAATGDDKVNLVASMLSKTEFLVPRTVARVSHPSNEWMFGDMWGVDVAVSTPRTMTALVEEAVSVGRTVKIFSFSGSGTDMVEITIPRRSPVVGRAVGSMRWPAACVLVGIIRDGQPLAPSPHDGLEAHDELLFLAEAGSLSSLEQLLAPPSTPEDPEELPSIRGDEKPEARAEER